MKTEKRQFVSITLTKTTTEVNAAATLAVDLIGKIENVNPKVPIFEDGARSRVFLKGKDGDVLHSTETREEIEAKLIAPVEKPALMRFRRKAGSKYVMTGFGAGFDVVAIVGAGYDPEIGRARVLYILRSDTGLILPTNDIHFQEMLEHHEEV